MVPIKGSIAITFEDQLLSLLPDRAIWWPARSALVVSDVHLGKAAAFRLTGVPVPSGATARDLSRLSNLIEQTDAKQLIVLGDFLHSRAGRQREVLDAITTWRQAHAGMPITLVRGNHDRSAGRLPIDWNIQEVEEPFVQEGICLIHDPERATQCPSLAGHVHPIVSVQDYDRSSISLPCFVVDKRIMILPAFGTFTGGHRMHRQADRKLYALAPGRVIQLPIAP